MPNINKKQIRVLEPSVGVGNFIPYIIAKYSYAEELIIDVVDINNYSISVLKELLKIVDIPENVSINYICDDYLLHNFENRYDVITGNPPFMKMNSNNKLLGKYRENCINDESNNTSSYFLEKSLLLADNVVMVMPKFLLNTSEYSRTRDYIYNLNIKHFLLL